MVLSAKGLITDLYEPFCFEIRDLYLAVSLRVLQVTVTLSTLTRKSSLDEET